MKVLFLLFLLSSFSFLNTSYPQSGDYLTEWEWQVIDELWTRLDALPDYSTEEEEKRVFFDIAIKYNISVQDLHILEEKAYYEEMYWWGL